MDFDLELELQPLVTPGNDMLPIFAVLHLSDPHFGPYSHWFCPPKKGASINPRKEGAKLAREVKAALERTELGGALFYIDAIVITGDFLWGGPLPQPYTGYPRTCAYESALAFTEELVKLKILDGARWRLLVVPGNHDIFWSRRDPYTPLSRMEAEKDYRQFLGALFHKDQTRERPHLGSCVVLPTREIPPRPVVLIGLNSCRIETRYTPALGWVGYDQIADLITCDLPERITEWKRLTGCDSLRHPLSIAALHHHLQLHDPRPLEQLSKHRSAMSYLTDAPETLDALIDLGFQVVLHGHAHSARRYLYGQHASRAGGPEREVSTLVVGGAGSVGLCLESGNIKKGHQFQVMEFFLDKIRVRSYETALKPAGSPRNWQTIEFEFSSRLDEMDETFCEAMIARISRGECSRARCELEGFDTLINFEALIRGEKFVKDRLFHDLFLLKYGVLSSTSSGPGLKRAAKACYDRLVDELPSRADRVRARLRKTLQEDPTDRLDRFLFEVCGWKRKLPDPKVLC